MTWEELQSNCHNCKMCELHKSKMNTVFGCGNKNADLMFVGEAPGEKEDISGIPFVGAAGMLLDKYLEAVGIDREEVYIANILKCRPPKNRDPEESEADCCIVHLREQVKLIRPKIIVCLGRIAAQRLIREDFKITKEHGIWFDKKAFSMCAVYHPSLLLRDLSKRGEMLCDMMSVAKKYNEIKEK